MIRCTIGVFAHNEAHNVSGALHALLMQRPQNAEIVEIVVVASGCTDGTVELAEEVASAFPIVSVDVERQRTGKASAIRRLMSIARGDVIVLVGADTLPDPMAIEHLLEPFADPHVGMTGARVVPLNAPTTWLGFTVQMLWHAHHRLALRSPKLGELVAFRNVIDDFPEDTSTDEPALEALIAKRGYRLVYTPKAVVYNRGPQTVREFMTQRRRICAGQVRIALRFGYLTSSMRVRHLVPLALEAIKNYPSFLAWTLGAMGLELGARLLGAFDAVRGSETIVWRTAASTKVLTRSSAPLTLIFISWSPGAIDSEAMLRDLQRLPEPGAVFWYDVHHGEMLLRLEAAESPLESIQDRVERVTRLHVVSEDLTPSASVSCRLVKLSPPLAT